MIITLLIAIIIIIIGVAYYIHVRLSQINDRLYWIAKVIYPTDYVFEGVGWKLGKELSQHISNNSIIKYMPLSKEAERLYIEQCKLEDIKEDIVRTMYSNVKQCLIECYNNSVNIDCVYSNKNIFESVKQFAKITIISKDIDIWEQQLVHVYNQLNSGSIKYECAIDVLKQYHCYASNWDIVKDDARIDKLIKEIFDTTFSIDTLVEWQNRLVNKTQ